MSAKKNKAARNRPAGEGRKPGSSKDDPRIPDAPPMSDGTLSRWPLVIVGAAFVLWLIWLAILMYNSARWGRE